MRFNRNAGYKRVKYCRHALSISEQHDLGFILYLQPVRADTAVTVYNQKLAVTVRKPS